MKKILLLSGICFLLNAVKKSDLNFTFTNPTSYTVSTLPSVLTSGAADVAVQPDGKFIVATLKNFKCIGARITLKRYNTDGSLDASFGTDGTATQLIGERAGALDLILQDDGKILAGGYTITDNISSFLIARFNTDGSLDITFNAAGTPGYRTMLTEFSATANDAMLWKMALQSDGKIVTTGYYRTSDSAYNHIAIVRHNADGTIDTTFGTAETPDGIARISEPTNSVMATDMVILDNDTIVLGGFIEYPATRREFYLIKLTQNGIIDTTFGDGQSNTRTGKQKNCISGQADELWALATQTDGKIIGIGSSNGTTCLVGRVTLIRYLTNGSIDTDFGSHGIIISNLPTSSISLVVKSSLNKKIVVGCLASKADFYAKRLIQYTTVNPQQLLNVYVE